MLAIHSELSGFEISNSSKVNAFYNKIKKKNVLENCHYYTLRNLLILKWFLDNKLRLSSNKQKVFIHGL